LHADWEWDLKAQCQRCDWRIWEVQSKRRRARALDRLGSEFDRLAEQSTALYLADGEALADVEAARAAGAGAGDNSAVVAAGNVAAP
jgi:hypothetical protein